MLKEDGIVNKLIEKNTINRMASNSFIYECYIQLCDLVSQMQNFPPNLREKIMLGKNLPLDNLQKYFYHEISPKNGIIKRACVHDDNLQDYFDLMEFMCYTDVSHEPVFQASTTLYSGRQQLYDSIDLTKHITKHTKASSKGTLDKGYVVRIIDQEKNFELDIMTIWLMGNRYVIATNNHDGDVKIFKYPSSLLDDYLDKFGLVYSKLFDIKSVKESRSIFEAEEDEFGDEFGDENMDEFGDENPEEDEIPDELLEDDVEYTQQMELIENNIAKIESLPDNIRESKDIRNVYLLLLGKKTELEMQNITDKNEEIIQNILDDISASFESDIDGL